MNDPIRPTAKNAIMEAGFRLLSAEPSSSLSRIAEHAGVGRATLHRHFTCRDELLRKLAMRAYEEMDEAAESAAEHAPSYSAALKNILDALIPLGDRHGFLAHFGLEDDAELKNEIARQAEETRDLIDAARGEGLFDPAIPTSWIERMYDAAVMAGWESMRAEETTLNQASELAWNSLIKGVGAKS